MNLEMRWSSCTMLRGCTCGMSPSGGPTCPWGPGYCPHWDRDFPSVLLHENGKVWKDPAVVAVKSSSVCSPGAQSHQDTWPNPALLAGQVALCLLHGPVLRATLSQTLCLGKIHLCALSLREEEDGNSVWFAKDDPAKEKPRGGCGCEGDAGSVPGPRFSDIRHKMMEENVCTCHRKCIYSWPHPQNQSHKPSLQYRLGGGALSLLTYPREKGTGNRRHLYVWKTQGMAILGKQLWKRRLQSNRGTPRKLHIPGALCSTRCPNPHVPGDQEVLELFHPARVVQGAAPARHSSRFPAQDFQIRPLLSFILKTPSSLFGLKGLRLGV